MKKNVKKMAAIVAVILGCSTSTFAQNGLTLRAGGNFPVGAFGNGENAVELALSNPNATFGGAATGFNAGLKYQLSLVGNFSAFATADFFYNGLKGDIKEAWKGDSENITLPAYMNIPVMVGLNYTILDIASATLWAEAGAGANFRSITKSSAKAALGTIVSGSAETTYNLTTTLVWQAGIGVSLAKTITLGLHYYSFGGADIKGESTSSGNLGGLISGGSKPMPFTYGNLNPSMVVVRLGYTF